LQNSPTLLQEEQETYSRR